MSLVRTVLYMPYVIELIGILNTLILTAVVGYLSIVKVECLCQSALSKHMYRIKDLIKRAFPRYWAHNLCYFAVFMSNFTDYIFIQYQIQNILRLFVNMTPF